MKDYREFTIGWLIFVFVIPAHMLLTYLFINHLGDRPLDALTYLIITFLFGLLYILFYGMTININSDSITVSFGIGLIRKKIDLKQIKSVTMVESPWYYGWGIRYIPNGMLYNISGKNGVELTFINSKRVIRIGAKNAQTLKNEIDKRAPWAIS